MVELGEGPYRTSEIAAKYGAVVNSVAPIRGNLTREEIISSLGHGGAEFTVPLFADFMRRAMPEGVHRTHP